MQVWSRQSETFRQWYRDAHFNDNYRSPHKLETHQSQKASYWHEKKARISDAADVRMDRSVVSWLKWDVWAQTARERDPFFQSAFSEQLRWMAPSIQTDTDGTEPAFLRRDDNIKCKPWQICFVILWLIIIHEALFHQCLIRVAGAAAQLLCTGDYELLTDMLSMALGRVSSAPSCFFFPPPCCFFAFLVTSWSMGAGLTNLIISVKPGDKQVRIKQ